MKNEYWENLNKGERKIAGTLAAIMLGFVVVFLLCLVGLYSPYTDAETNANYTIIALFATFGGIIAFGLLVGYTKYLESKTMVMIKKELQNRDTK